MTGTPADGRRRGVPAEGPGAPTARRRHDWPSAFSVPAARADRFGTARVRVRIAAPADLERACDWAAARVPARLELPTSLFPHYERLRRGPRRIVDVERHVLDQRAGDVDLDLLDRLAQRREGLWIPPSPEGVDAACRFALLGLAVVLDSLRRWSPEDLVAVAACVAPGEPAAALLEPFASLPSSAQGPDASQALTDLYGEGAVPCLYVTDDGRVARSADHAHAGLFVDGVMASTSAGALDVLDAPSAGLPAVCSACPALATCRGYWLGVPGGEQHCAAWQRIFASSAHEARAP